MSVVKRCRIMALALSAFATGCADESALPPCGSLPALQPAAVCAVSGAADAPQALSSDRLELVVDGLIVAMGQGEAPEGCFEHSHDRIMTAQQTQGVLPVAKASGALGTDPETWWFSVEDEDEGVWTFAVWMPGYGPPVAAGDNVRVRYGLTLQASSPSKTHLFIERDGQPLVMIARAGRIEELGLKGALTLSRGEPLCVSESACGTWAYHALEARLPEMVATVAYGSEAVLGAWRVFDYGQALSLSSALSCPAWHVASSWVAVTYDPGADALAPESP